jgi:hypothetical protein
MTPKVVNPVLIPVIIVVGLVTMKLLGIGNKKK